MLAPDIGHLARSDARSHCRTTFCARTRVCMSASKPSCHKQGMSGASPRQSSALFSAQAILEGAFLPGLSVAEAALFSTTAHWLDQTISKPHPELGRSGDVCPWTRRTHQLGRLFLTSIASCDPVHVDGRMSSLLTEFGALANLGGALDTFRAIVVVFPALAPAASAEFMITTHRRLKPAFLKNRMMLGEFYPGCPKPGLHNPSFRPLHAPLPLLVIRAMVEPDLRFLTDQDAFLDFYLDAFGERGFDNVRQLLRDSSELLDPEHVGRLRRRVSLVY